MAELTKLAESLEALLGEWESDDAMRCPFVRSDGLGFGVLAEERELVEVVLLERRQSKVVRNVTGDVHRAAH